MKKYYICSMENNKIEIKKECEIDYTKYIGRKVKGFKFETNKNKLFYTENMQRHVDQIGTIKALSDRLDYLAYRIDFSNGDYYFYPAEDTLNHLVEVEQPPLKKFINLSSKETSKKETVFTEANFGGDWFTIDSNAYKKESKIILYHGELQNNRGSLFIAEMNDGKLVILKGIKGDEFNG